jgi:hypothetical protein
MSEVNRCTQGWLCQLRDFAQRAFPWMGRGRELRTQRYSREKYYMRGPGPAWRAKQAAAKRDCGV